MMRRDLLDHYSRQDSLLHRASTEAKLVVALTVVCVTVAVPVLPLPYSIALAAALVGTALVARIPLRFVVLRLLLVSPFVMGVAVLGHGWTIVVKSALCVVTMVLLANTTPFAELLRVLRRSRVPALLVTTLALMYRYLFVLADEAERMQRARAARIFDRRRWRNRKTLATVAGQLFVRSTERAERIYAAMLARGWK
jgi:cobalt/nickel transport system permease protein